ncbi:Gpi16 subunit, GPI transamidase component [Hesseltinella vesiculosa]|uniref:Gpi16 subunit, GPI transamidase component n=1 Tax=Hesseltinella vesiculosa TaxID=101127 RepID=A0A1X2GKY7_9FUNG|nr:Gpi16 subunit, GPI transamidase component [Hesseltinella vesiculosa]
MRSLVAFCLLCFGYKAVAKDQFTEKLTFTPLSDGKVLAHFDFLTEVDAPFSQNVPLIDYDLFPKAIGQVMQTYSVRDLNLKFTQGRWLYDTWGLNPDSSSGTGVELWAWMDDPHKDVEHRWKSLTNVLSGLFCASLNFLDETLTVEPRLSFQQQPLSPNGSLQLYTPSQPAVLRYGVLPQENVCTENLTPWIKLLPCKSKAGIASLLNPHKIYNSNFHSMSIHTQSICKDPACFLRTLAIKQTVTSVLDPVRETGRRDWSLDSLFDRSLLGTCPMADRSQILVETPRDKARFQLLPTPTAMDDSVAVYDLHKDGSSLNVVMQWEELAFEFPLHPSVQGRLLANRYFTGYGQERGGLRVTLQNLDTDNAMKVTYFDVIPWYLKLFLHTLQIQVIQNGESLSSESVILDLYYQPAVDRARPNMLECQLELPANSVVTMTIDFDKMFLKYTEHRPDANRGFDIGSAVITLEDKSRIYTDTMLVSLPTPDFSMPYNVITLTCTVIALFFGSLFNLLIRSFAVVEEKEAKSEE